ncbi:choice-of-anchor J domain-containing protein [Paraflavitalea speifideaquila]|uniref:choice-of-anchor J domain-containing protein n=1 Tax=Paraflavitalea speifideaquila TaxID=3076558 RepID=UPI0028E7A4F8|nr:choice-of-anchor J domain-containing protein [Paraflavitalea speifideiaquila]
MAWRQGRFEYGGKLGDEVVGFPAYSSTFSQNEYVSVDMNCGLGSSTLSAWLISPPTDMKNGDEFSFYTRTKGDYADRMQVWINTKTSNAFVGKAAVDTGDFSPKLLDINPGMGGAYPAVWTKYTITLSGITGTKKAASPSAITC